MGKMTYMQSGIFHKLVISSYILLFMMVVFAGIINGLEKHSQVGYNDGEYTTLDNNMTFDYELGDDDKADFPTYIKKDKGSTLYINGILPSGIKNDSYLFIYSDNQNIKINVDDKQIGEYDGIKKANAWFFVKLNEKYSSKKVSICVAADKNKSIGYISNIYIGDKTAIIYNFVKTHGFSVALGIIMIITGIITLFYIAFTKRKEYEVFLFYSGFQILSGLFLFYDANIRQFYLSKIGNAEKIVPVLLLTSMVTLILMFIYNIKFHKGKTRNLIFIAIFGNVGGITYDLLINNILHINNINDGMVIGDFIFAFIGVHAYIHWIGEVNFIERRALVRNEEKTAFLGRMSHQIRTPVNSVLGMNTLILDESENEKVREYAQDIEIAGNSLVSIIDDILDFTKIGTDEIKLHLNSYRISSLINDCYNMIQHRAENKKLNFNVKNNPELPDCLIGDDARIRQIIINLLTNAVKYTHKGEVCLNIDFEYISETEIKLIIEVKDTGIGIKKENISNLFADYKRFDELKNKAIEGTGLGLSITRNLVDMMNGRIFVDSEYGKGSTFSVLIPQKINGNAITGDIGRAFDTINKQKRRISWFKAPQANVLIVDDVEMNLKVMAGLLRKSGMRTELVTTGLECIEKIKSQKYDLIFMDHLMPEMDGIKTYAQMKKTKNNQNTDTPVIMLTANAVTGAREIYIKAGFRDYISKPIDEKILRDMCIKYLPAKLIQQNVSRLDEKVFVNDRKLKDSNGSDDALKDDYSIGDKEKSIGKYDRTENKTAPVKYAEYNDVRINTCRNFLDIDTAMEFCLNDEELYIDILGEFCEQDKFKNSNKLIESGQWKEYQILMHTLKGTARTIGALELSAKAEAMENAAENQNKEYIHDNIEDINKSYSVLVAQIKEIL